MRNAKDIITVPYLSVLGLIHPDEITDNIISNIEKSSNQKLVLPYDKQIRWSDKPLENIIKIQRDNGNLQIETIQNNRRCLYVYGNDINQTDDNYDTIINVSIVARDIQPNEACTVAYLDTYNHRLYSDSELVFAHKLSTEKLNDIQYLGDESTASGFRYLVESGRVNDKSSPIIVELLNGKIVGAIGPLNILEDSRGIKRLLPTYFGVSKEAKRKGIGTKLWNQSRQWAVDNEAQYSVLQAEYNSPANAFYDRNGLVKLGYVYKITMNK